MRISFEVLQSVRDRYDTTLEKLASRHGVKRVLDIGGGANPALPLDFIETRKLDYVLLDVSSWELAKAPDGYMKVQADIMSPDLDIGRDYDLVISKTVAEHVPNGRIFHENVWRLLAEDGIAFHFFPTLYAPPFVLNRLLPEGLSERLLLILQPNRKKEGRLGKFPSYYSWCRGPLSSQIRGFENLGYRVEEYVGFFGHGNYYGRIKHLKAIHERLSAALARHPIPWLTSFAYVVLSKQET